MPRNEGPRAGRPDSRCACVPQIGAMIEWSTIMRTRWVLKAPGFLLLLAAAAHAQNGCRFDLAGQTDGATSGFFFSLVATADSSGNCQLGSVMLELSVGNGT